MAITRPRTKPILVGSRRVLEAEPDLPECQAWVELFRDLAAQCTIFTAPFHFSPASPAVGASG